MHQGRKCKYAELLFNNCIGSVFSVNWNQEGTLLVTASEDKTVRVLDFKANTTAIQSVIKDDSKQHAFTAGLIIHRFC